MATLTPRVDGLERNLIINGNFDFWQRSTSMAMSGVGLCTADRWKNFISSAYIVTVSQSTDVPTFAQSGFQSRFSQLLTNGTGASPGTAQYVQLAYRMEGGDYESVHGRKVRIQFWVKSSIPGTYPLTLMNGAQTRSYNTTFVVSSASTWQKIVIDVALDTSGTWLFDNGIGLGLYVSLSMGTDYQTSNLNTWQSTSSQGVTGQVQWASTTGATFQISQVMLIPQDFTTAGASTVDVPFQRNGRSIQQELAACQRYLFNPMFGGPATPQNYLGSGMCLTGTLARIIVNLPTQMRAAPTVVSLGASDFVVLSTNGTPIAVTSFSADQIGTATVGVNFNVASGLTGGSGTLVRGNAATSLMTFDAEL